MTVLAAFGGAQVVVPNLDRLSPAEVARQQQAASKAQKWLLQELKRIQKSATAEDRTNDKFFWLVDHLSAFLQGKTVDDRRPFSGTGLLPPNHVIQQNPIGVNHTVILAVGTAWSLLDESLGPKPDEPNIDLRTRNSVRRAFIEYQARLAPAVRNAPYEASSLSRAQRFVLEVFGIYVENDVTPGPTERIPSLTFHAHKSIDENLGEWADAVSTENFSGDALADVVRYLRAIISSRSHPVLVGYTLNELIHGAEISLDAAFPGQIPNLSQLPLREKLLNLRNFLLEPDRGSHNTALRYEQGDDVRDALVFINAVLILNPKAALRPSDPKPPPAPSRRPQEHPVNPLVP